ncbi:GLPGLI family protein [Zunongwangia pacifica]|uniref:GLPGLI family protein n=1 Tax=Zunongwangia pacifica TaxID=2911062 RepID=A0A9X1ZUG8_9FLAO|nr:GLPGLI family protein [Zunongwangia pacifica]MCL6218668.1 GLPGLI family protein [Zunongwangia pacifica]
MKLKLFMLLIFFSVNILAQEELKEKFNYKVTYKLDFKLDSTSAEKRSEYMILYLGDDISQFSSRAYVLANPIVRRGNNGSTSRAAVTKFFTKTIKDQGASKMYNSVFVPMTDFFYVQELRLFDWEIHSETKIIKDYKVQKATTSFAGRDYMAWFTTEIPVSDGPYKFNGLPGLILEIADTGNDYVFSFIGLEKITPALTYKINFNQYIKTTQEDIAEILHEYRRDPPTYVRAQGINTHRKVDPEWHKKMVAAFTKMLEKENNPIELE